MSGAACTEVEEFAFSELASMRVAFSSMVFILNFIKLRLKVINVGLRKNLTGVNFVVKLL